MAPYDGGAPNRVVDINDTARNAERGYPRNDIKTSKYTKLNFLPLNLMEQFQRAANMYFLIIIILESFPSISPVSPWTSLMPLIFVLTLTAAKEALEDFRRHKSDEDINNAPVQVLRDNQFVQVPWHALEVGDIVRIHKNEHVPADLLTLATSDDQDVAFIETKQLDGETNLKIRDAVLETSHCKTEEDLSKIRGQLVCELPNTRLYTFEGRLSLENGGGGGGGGGGDVDYDAGDSTSISIDNSKIILRGCVLRNTHWVLGLVVFSGRESKLMLNASDPPNKRSQLERGMNQLLYQVFAMQFTMVAISSIFAGVWVGNNTHSHIRTYIMGTSEDEDPGVVGGKSLLTFLVIYNVMVPISLYVSLELAKTYHAWLINNDTLMYYAPGDIRAVARTSNLSDDLGLIEYLFSDKTGTLTRNQMVFRQCTIGGVQYGRTNSIVHTGEDEAGGAGTSVAALDPASPGSDFAAEADAPADAIFQFVDPRFAADRDAGDGEDAAAAETAATIHLFLVALSVCHTVIIEHPDGDVEQPGEYQASSPDEAALVAAAKYMGHRFCQRNQTEVSVAVDGRDELLRYSVLNVLEFNSTRKRMSVIVRTPENRILLFCKGADSVIYERLSDQSQHRDTTMAHLQEYAVQGLRTLVIAYRELDEATYASWAEQHHAASVALENRAARMEEVASQIEQQLLLIGATAIEDKLQHGVPETIATLQRAGIKIWVLTGDKQETAINIGFSSALLTSEMQLIILNATSRDGTQQQLVEALDQYIRQREAAGGTAASDGPPLALVIDGHTLHFALEPELEESLVRVGRQCVAVVCCRVSPLQKALVVRLVKRHERAMTAAIGDGANDVTMIQAAHIGIGLAGEEGMQAVLASDYAFGQFRYLQRLFLVHGRWSYRRVEKLVLYSFYKNILLVLPQLWFQLGSAFSGQTFYDSWLPSLFNMIFTAFPIMCYAGYEQDVSARMLGRYPELYRKSVPRVLANFKGKHFWSWLADAVYGSVIVYWFSVLAMDSTHATEASGRTHGLWASSTLAYTCVVVIATFKVALITHYWTQVTHAFIWGSFLLYLLVVTAYNLIPQMPMYWVLFEMLDSFPFWAVVVLATVAALTPSFARKYFNRQEDPSPAQVVQELQAMEKTGHASLTPLTRRAPPLRRATSFVDPRDHKQHFHTGFAFSHTDGQYDVISGVRGKLKKLRLRNKSRRSADAMPAASPSNFSSATAAAASPGAATSPSFAPPADLDTPVTLAPAPPAAPPPLVKLDDDGHGADPAPPSIAADVGAAAPVPSQSGHDDDDDAAAAVVAAASAPGQDVGSDAGDDDDDDDDDEAGDDENTAGGNTQQ